MTNDDLKELQSITKTNKELIIKVMENCGKIMDHPEKFGDVVAYKAASLIFCLDSLMSIISSTSREKIDQTQKCLMIIQKDIVLENKEYQMVEHSKNPNFISQTPKTIQ
jgi:hypothetical protein